MSAATRFQRGDAVEIPARLRKSDGASRMGTVIDSWRTHFTDRENYEICLVGRIVGGRYRHSVIREDELYRLTVSGKP